MLARLWSGQKTLGPWGVWTDTGIFAEKKLSGRGFNSDYLHVTALLPFSLTLGGMPLPPIMAMTLNVGTLSPDWLLQEPYSLRHSPDHLPFDRL